MQELRRIAWLGLAVSLAGCGGGGGGSAPPPPPAPVASLGAVPVSTYGVQDGDISATVQLGLNFKPTGDFSVQVELQDGQLLVPTLTPVAGAANQYSVHLAMNSSALAGLYRGTAHMKLCADAACKTRQAIPEIDFDYVFDVLPPGTTWPGDHLTTLAPWPDAPEWSTFQGNAAHTGFVPVDIDPAAITPRWRIMGTGETISDYNGYPQTITATAGRFFQSSQHDVLARSEDDGRMLWQFDFTMENLEFPLASPPAVYGDTVYLIAGQQSSTWFYGLDAATGTRRFHTLLESQWDRFLAPTAGATGIYAEGGEYGGLYGFDPATGSERFFDALDAGARVWTPAVDASGVYYFARGQFRAFDPASGAVLASIDDPAQELDGYGVVGAPVIGSPGHVYAATYEQSTTDGGRRGNVLSAFDVAGGRIAWQATGNFPTTPAFHGGHLFVANENPYRIESRAEADGAIEWSWTPPAEAGTHFRSEPLVTNNLLFVSTDTTTYAIDLATREIVWRYPMSGRLALSRSGLLYIQNALLVCAFNLR
jgi:outer membrane protein assembly factor BamB